MTHTTTRGPKILFVPLNTNHVLIFHNIIKSLPYDYEVLCHDNLCTAAQCYTGNALRKLDMPFIQFPSIIRQEPQAGVIRQTMIFFRQRSAIRRMLDEVNPTLIILAIDNDPISQIVITESRRRGSKTILVPEGLLHPALLSERKKYVSQYIYGLMRFIGIYLNYVKYGTGGCDRILVSGKRALEILKGIGAKSEAMTIVGQQKYDSFIDRIRNDRNTVKETGVFLYAASLDIFRNIEELRLVRNIASATRKLSVHLVIKLHPRTPQSPSELYDRIKIDDAGMIEIVKEGYDTYEILRMVDTVITISSAIIFEALIMNKECILIDYLAGLRKLSYDAYDAVFNVKSETELFAAMQSAIYHKKADVNKRRLLDDELYKLDGRGGERVADCIEEMLSSWYKA